MIHHNIKNDNSGDHYGVSYNYLGNILLQVQQAGEQVRVPLDIEQSKHIIELLIKNIVLAEQAILDNE